MVKITCLDQLIASETWKLHQEPGREVNINSEVARPYVRTAVSCIGLFCMKITNNDDNNERITLVYGIRNQDTAHLAQKKFANPCPIASQA